MSNRSVSRRTALRVGLLASSGTLASVANARVPEVVGSRSNILFLFADDWSWQGARARDLTNAKLPTFDRLKREGAMFENAFVAAPTCTASRGAVLAGRWGWRLEEGFNLASILPRHFPLYTELLESAGYHVGMMGKGWGPGRLEPAGRTINPAGANFESFDAFVKARPIGLPFCFWAGVKMPHRPYDEGIGIRSGIDPNEMIVPPYLEDTPVTRSDMCDYRYYSEMFDRAAGMVIDRLEALGELDNTLVVMSGDNGWPFPRAKATLYDAGTHVPLVMRFPPRIRAGTVRAEVVSLIDLAGTFLDVARVPQPESMNSRSLLPLLAGRKGTSRGYALIGRERHVDGGERTRIGYPARAIRTREFLYIRNFQPDRYPAGVPARRQVSSDEVAKSLYATYADIDPGPTKANMALSTSPAAAHFRALAVGKRPAQELYNIRHDPFQINNLANSPQYKGILQALDKALMTALKETGDPRVVGTVPEIFEQYPIYHDPGFGRPEDFEDYL